MTFQPQEHMAGMARILHALWVAFLSATIVCAVVAILLVRGRGPAGGTLTDLRLARPVMWVIGAIGLALAILLRRRLLRRSFRDAGAALIGVQSAMVAGWAAVEAVAIIGLVLVFLGGSVLDGAPFFLAALLVVALQRPSAARLRKQIEVFARGGTSTDDP